MRLANPDAVFDDRIANQALIQIEDLVLNATNRPLTQFGMPSPDRSQLVTNNRMMIRETTYDREELAAVIETRQGSLTAEQSVAMETVLASVHAEQGKFIFLDAPGNKYCYVILGIVCTILVFKGGTGKTFLINLLLAKVRLEGHIALATASSGIAATLLTGGRTAHSAFHLPLNLVVNETPICSIPKNGIEAELLRSTRLIVIDECSMLHKRAFEAIDRLLKDLRDTNLLFGGVTVLIAGDFRQCLPVVPSGTSADQLNACLKASPLWAKVNVSLHSFDLFNCKLITNFV